MNSLIESGHSFVMTDGAAHAVSIIEEFQTIEHYDIVVNIDAWYKNLELKSDSWSHSLKLRKVGSHIMEIHVDPCCVFALEDIIKFFSGVEIWNLKIILKNDFMPLSFLKRIGLSFVSIDKGDYYYMNNGEKYPCNTVFEDLKAKGLANRNDYKGLKSSDVVQANKMGFHLYETVGHSIWNYQTKNNKFSNKNDYECLETLRKEECNEFKACIILNKDKKTLRRMESTAGIFLEGFPDLLKNWTFERMSFLREKFFRFEDMVNELDISEKTLASILSCYGLKTTPEQKSLQVRHQMAEYKKKAGYGSPAADPEVRRKIEDTCEKRYGVRNVFYLDSVQDSIRKSWESKTDDELQDIKDRRLKTLNERYGGNSAMCDPEVREKSRATCMDKYGVPFTGSAKEVREKNRINQYEKVWVQI